MKMKQLRGSGGVRININDLCKTQLCISELKTPTSRLRILNPFDPAGRNRKRLSRLFGFDYRVEMFVTASKRVWGYYIYPLLEGNRFVGRIEIKADRKNNLLNVQNVWLEAGVNWTPQRVNKLNAELVRLAKLVSCEVIDWDYPAEALAMLDQGEWY